MPEDSDRPLTIPDVVPIKRSKKLFYKHVPVRFPDEVHIRLSSLLKRDKLSIQKFMVFCARAYIEADPAMISLVKKQREEDIYKPLDEPRAIPHKQAYMESILDEIEKAERKK